MKARTTGKITVIALAVAVALVIILFRGVSAELVYPVEKCRQVLLRKAWARVQGMLANGSAAAENMRLRREVASLAMVRQDCEQLESENARLREALGCRVRLSGDWKVAEVLSQGGAASARRMLRIGRGSRDGIAVGAVVAAPAGLVGKVAAVTPHTAEVVLITDVSLQVSCEVETTAGQAMRGVLSGGSDDLLFLRHISGAEQVHPRARVLTSGLGGVFPRGLPVGTLIDGVRDGDDRYPSEGAVQPSVDFSTLQDVFVRCEN